jgi:spoIIIJ-associated protein
MSEPEDDVLEPEELLQEVVEEILDALGLEAEVEVAETGNVMKANVRGEELGRLIGRRGQTIDAVQHLAQRIVFQGERSNTRVVIDADGYRERREEELREQGDRAADEVIRTSRAVELDPMPAAERRVVHEHLRERGDVETFSEGEEPERYLVVAPLGQQ